MNVFALHFPWYGLLERLSLTGHPGAGIAGLQASYRFQPVSNSPLQTQPVHSSLNFSYSIFLNSLHAYLILLLFKSGEYRSRTDDLLLAKQAL